METVRTVIGVCFMGSIAVICLAIEGIVRIRFGKNQRLKGRDLNNGYN